MSFYNQEMDRIAELEKENEALRQQRDELLEALEEVIAISNRKHDAWDKAKAAIAKAKGENE